MHRLCLQSGNRLSRLSGVLFQCYFTAFALAWFLLLAYTSQHYLKWEFEMKRFFNVRPSFCTKIIFTIYQTFCSFFLNWKSYAGFPNVWSFDREKSALLEKHDSEWKMLEFISFCAIYSLPIWFFSMVNFMHSNPFTKE